MLFKVGRSRCSGGLCVSGSCSDSAKLSDSPLDRVSDDVSDTSDPRAMVG